MQLADKAINLDAEAKEELTAEMQKADRRRKSELCVSVAGLA